MNETEHSDDAVIEFIDAWAQDYANDEWRALSGADQLREGRRIMDAALEGLLSQGFDGLTRLAQMWLDAYYPADIPLLCNRNSPDPGPRLTAALRDCIEARA